MPILDPEESPRTVAEKAAAAAKQAARLTEEAKKPLRCRSGRAAAVLRNLWTSVLALPAWLLIPHRLSPRCCPRVWVVLQLLLVAAVTVPTALSQTARPS